MKHISFFHSFLLKLLFSSEFLARHCLPGHHVGLLKDEDGPGVPGEERAQGAPVLTRPCVALKV